MSPTTRARASSRKGPPRASGDEPHPTQTQTTPSRVRPARAGMSPGLNDPLTQVPGPPRASGDEPLSGADLSGADLSAPRERG